MKLVVISSSPFIKKDNNNFAYSPYVKELEIWAKYSDEIAFTCPLWEKDNGLLVSKISFPITTIYEVKGFNIKTLLGFLKALRFSFINFYLLYKSMVWADHIHLRCPGNIGLMGCILQILFPYKPKTAKYAGNWDPKSKQPISYTIQKWILSNEFLTKNMQVLVYGEWENSSKNIKPFFTASYKEIDKETVFTRDFNGIISFLFVGTLANGKNPLYAVKLIETLKLKGNNVQLLLFGEGNEKFVIEKYIDKHQLRDYVIFKGNQNQEVIKKVYQESHFVILPSKSEGWPKVIAEGMFWGCLPISSKVSCVPNMLDNGKRGLLLNMIFDDDVKQIEVLLKDNKVYHEKVSKAIDWSRKYTLDFFENEVRKLLKP